MVKISWNQIEEYLERWFPVVNGLALASG